MIEVLMQHFENNDLNAFSQGLDQDFNINEKDNMGRTLLMRLVSILAEQRPVDHLAMLKLLIKKGGKAYIDVPQNISMRTALMHAIQANYSEGVFCLLENGANPNLNDYIQRNALGFALIEKNIAVAELLVHYDIKLQNETGVDKTRDSIISKLFWVALRLMPTTIVQNNREVFYSYIEEGYLSHEAFFSLEENKNHYISLANKHNENLLEHPWETAKALALGNILCLDIARLVSEYLYKDKGLQNNFEEVFKKQKSIMYSGSAPTQNGIHTNIPTSIPSSLDKVKRNEPSLSYDKKRGKKRK